MADDQTYPPYVPGTNYKGGELVTHNGLIYEVKPFPVSGFAGISPQHYEPGKGIQWRDVWIQR